MKTINYRFILIITTSFFYSMASFANNSSGEWKPQIVEKMYLLPPKHLNKVLNNDFNKSILALNLQTTDNKIKDRIEKISELNSMLKGASKNETLEIKHQIIINKRDYIKDMSNLLTMKRQKLDTKKSFFQKIQKNIRNTSLNRKTNSEFLNNKNNALKRAESIDFKILDSAAHSMSKTSKYFKQYQINKDAVKKLKLAIQKHPMSNKNILSKDPKKYKKKLIQ